MAEIHYVTTKGITRMVYPRWNADALAGEIPPDGDTVARRQQWNDLDSIEYMTIKRDRSPWKRVRDWVAAVTAFALIAGTIAIIVFILLAFVRAAILEWM